MPMKVAARPRETQPVWDRYFIASSHLQDGAMNQNIQHHSNAWVTFTYASFGASAFLVAIGVYFLPVDLWIKGYLAMGIAMLIQSCVTLTKTVRDVHESSRLMNRIEDAKAERLLMEVSKTA
jgi:hypothetical protein